MKTEFEIIAKSYQVTKMPRRTLRDLEAFLTCLKLEFVVSPSEKHKVQMGM